MTSVRSQSRTEVFELVFGEILVHLGVHTYQFLSLLREVFASTNLCDIDRVVIDLAKLLHKLPAAFYQLNFLIHPYARVEFNPRRSVITSFVLKTPNASRIILLDSLQENSLRFHNFTASQLQEILANPIPGDPVYENLYNVTDSALQESLAQLAQDILDSNISKNCRRNVLKFLRRSGAVPPSLLLYELEQLAPFKFTGLSDLFHGRLRTTRVVIKKPRNLKSDLDKVEILRELILCRQFHHPNVLPFVGVSYDDRDSLYGLVTPFMAHGNVIEFLRRYPDTNRLIPIFQIMKGLQFLHSWDTPVAHRDIKGANVLVKNDLVCCLSDFGLSSTFELSERSREQAVGTAAWMAPEMLAPPERGRLDLLKVDIFALGITILEIYAGKPPSYRQHIYAIHNARVTRREKPHLPLTCPHPLPPFLSELVGMMLEYNPTDRPSIRMICQGTEDVLSPPSQIVLTDAIDPQNADENEAFDTDSASVRARAQQLVEIEWEHIGQLMTATRPSNGVTDDQLPQNATSPGFRRESSLQRTCQYSQLNCVAPMHEAVLPPSEMSHGPCAHVADVPFLPRKPPQ